MTDHDVRLDAHFKPAGVRDRIALGVVKFMRIFADLFFRKRYGHRAVVLETVAAVPGMDDHGFADELTSKAPNLASA